VKILYKILTPEEWDTFQRERVFRGSDLDLGDGFIHASLEDQVAGILDKFFKGTRPVFLVKLDASKLHPDTLKLEANKPGGTMYPHIYGTIPFDAVISYEKLT
jgi:uncharacterized protein (DUF952 family)